MGVRRIPKRECEEHWCPIEVALGAIGGMWKVIIIRELFTGVKRYGELHRALGGVTHKMLTQQLRELEADGVLTRTVYPVVPPKVEYLLTPLGEKLKPIMDAMHEWGTGLGKRKRKEKGLAQNGKTGKKAAARDLIGG
jgi:DNA-binding HxlR family transcriptional regulator